ncbi:MAG: zinc ribbon domain-containing protein [Chloroflexi bacterium]|nr:zinc ribbon domain-containing protein [Chloroflexota bacterium]
MSDSGWNTFVNMLKYKGNWYGCRIIEINRWFPSSKRCHVCGYMNDNLTLKDRSWLCPECNTNHDIDLNAAINILTFGRAGIAQTILPSLGGTRNACGEGSSSLSASPRLRKISPSLKQEATSEPCPSES